MSDMTTGVLAFGALMTASLVVSWNGARPMETTLPPAQVAALEGPQAQRDTIVLAGGCFWGVQAVFLHVDGVLGAASGYAGDGAATANYSTVSTGRTRHAESVQIVYDPSVVTLPELLRVFFGVAHDPTQVDRQGPDHGPQYRSVIFYRNEAQERIARAYIAQLERSEVFDDRIATQVTALPAFYPAEDYHQDYLVNHPRQPYIVMHDMPKLRHLESAYPEMWRERAVAWNADAQVRSASE